MTARKNNVHSTVESEAQEEFRTHEARYQRIGLDLEEELDRMAKEDIKKISARGLVYPWNGTTEEKWFVLRKAYEKTEKEKQIAVVRTQIEAKLHTIDTAIQSGDAEAYKTAIYSPPHYSTEELEQMEIGLDEELQAHPELQPLINDTRNHIGRLRRLL